MTATAEQNDSKTGRPTIRDRLLADFCPTVPRFSSASRILVCLVTVLVLSAGIAGAVAATPTGESTLLDSDRNSLEDTTDELGDTLDETTDDVENTTNETTDGDENTTNETTDTIDETVSETTDGLDDTTEETTETVNETTIEPTDTVDLLDSNISVETFVGPTTADLEASIDVSGANDTQDGNETADDDDGGAPSNTADDTDDDSPPGGTSPATDAVLIGLLGAITASGAAAGAGAGAGSSGAVGGASSATASWIRQTTGLRHLRRAGSILPWKLVPIFKYSRYDDSDPLENDHRRAVYETITDNPGCYLSQVSEQSGVALSTVRHHVDVLEDEGLVTTAKVNGKRRYYLETDSEMSTARDDGAVPNIELHAALEEPAKRALLETLAVLGTAPNGRLADELERDPSTVSHHLSALEDAGLVVRKKEGRSVVNELETAVETALSDEEASLEDDTAESLASATAGD